MTNNYKITILFHFVFYILEYHVLLELPYYSMPDHNETPLQVFFY